MSEFDLDQAKERAQSSIENAVSGVREFLGVEFEAHVCKDCNVPCEPSMAYDSNRAESMGKQPSWYCSNCNTHYIREETEEQSLTGDMYGRQ